MPRGDNVLILTIDSLRPDYLGCYGAGYGLSPNIDGLAARGFVFQHAFCQAPWTKPSVASTFTSLYPSVHGANDKGEHGVDVQATTDKGAAFVLSGDLPLLPETLAAAGYATGGFTGGGYLNPFFGFQRGFTHYDHGKSNLKDSLAPLCRWMEEQGSPFFAYVHCFNTHYPYLMNNRLQWGLGRLLKRIQLTHVQIGEVNDRGGRLAPQELKYLKKLYRQAIASTDRFVGQIVAALKRMRKLDNTLLLITADHGEAFCEHGLLGHSDVMYNELLRIPYVIHYPAIGGGRSVDGTVEALDLFPTLLDLLEVPGPADRLQGTSYATLFGGGGEGKRFAYSECERRGRQRALQDRDFKLLVTEQSARRELYDLRRDPGETRDLAREVPERLAEYEAHLKNFLERMARWKVDKGIGQGSQAAGEMDEQVASQLRALGYL